MLSGESRLTKMAVLRLSRPVASRSGPTFLQIHSYVTAKIAWSTVSAGHKVLAWPWATFVLGMCISST